MGYRASLFSSMDAASLVNPTRAPRSGSPLNVVGAQASLHRLSAWLEQSSEVTRKTGDEALAQVLPRHREQIAQYTTGLMATVEPLEERLHQGIARLSGRVEHPDKQPTQEQFQEELAHLRQDLARVLMAQEQVKGDVQQRVDLLTALARS